MTPRQSPGNRKLLVIKWDDDDQNNRGTGRNLSFYSTSKKST